MAGKKKKLHKRIICDSFTKLNYVLIAVAVQPLLPAAHPVCRLIKGNSNQGVSALCNFASRRPAINGIEDSVIRHDASKVFWRRTEDPAPDVDDPSPVLPVHFP
jgi:hypothetical protein